MSHGKETPRQKMIGMMYLVFLAMVAINVSGEVMLAFDVIDEGLLKTLENLESTNKETLEQFASEKQMNPTKVTSWFDKAQKVSEEANYIVEFIQEKKIAMVGADDESVQDGKVIVADLKGKDRTDAPYNVMVGEKDNLAGDSLKHMLDDFRERLLNEVIAEDAEKARHSIEGSLKTDDDEHHGGEGLEHHSWSSQHFHHLPMGGVITIMSGLQINVRNAEAEALNYLYSQIDAGSFKFNKLDATVIPNSSYIIKGNDYTADVFLAASDTTAKPTIYFIEGKHVYDSAIDNGEMVYTLREGVKYDTLKIVEGKGKFFRPTRGIGENFWGGLIEITGPKGNKIRKPFKRSYMVAEGSVVVSPTKMNLFYMGVENPVDVSVSGVRPENVSITARNAVVKRKRGGSFVILPKRPGNSMVTVYETVGGTRKVRDTKEFRVKTLPTPVAKVGGKKGGSFPKNQLLLQKFVLAEMENFEFDLTYKVVTFTVSATVGGFTKNYESKSNKFTQQQRQLMQSMNRGDRLYIQDIKAIGPEGTPKALSTIDFVIK